MKTVQQVVAIDGPSGSGKSTIAKTLADKLDLLYVDTGAMFRALALWAHRQKIAFEEGNALVEFLEKINLEYGAREGTLIAINGVDLSEDIRDHEVSYLASQMSQLPSVRKYLLDFQRSLLEKNICIMEGRDIGTVVFPEAFCKVFLTANAEIRAKRRWLQLKEQGDEEVLFETVLADVRKRDETDRERSEAPLKMSDDATLVDSSELNTEGILELLLNIIEQKAKEKNIALGAQKLS